MDKEEIAETVSQLQEVNTARAAFYRMLASLYFTELTQEQIEHLSPMDFSAYSGGDALIAEGYADIHRDLHRLTTGTRQELAVDYAHTFLAAGNYDSFVATPYESVFTSENGLLMQDARDDVYRLFCEEHIQPQEDLKTPEDHVSFEFQFIALLLEKTNNALEQGDYALALDYATRADAFHKNHQLNWIDRLCDAIIDNAQTRFYRGVSKITRGFVHSETEVFADEVEVIGELENAAVKKEENGEH